MESKINVGIIGCGNIFKRYVEGCRRFPILNIVACADIDLPRAQARAQELGIPKWGSPEELLADPDIQLVINLTVPVVHAEVSLAILSAGKHVYSEKPLAITREDGRAILDAARERGLLVGCAPDTFLGGGLQTCRRLIDEGAIGTPVAATAFMASHGPESWHPNPDFFYKVGGGPMLDMGPYYLTALINFLGPVKRVTGSARASFSERIATSPELNGHRIEVEVATHVAGVLDFHQGAIATLITSFDIWSHNLPRIEIYGSEGTLSVPDPNAFGGPVRLRRAREEEREIPLMYDGEVERGIGVADMAYAIVYGRPHRASGELAYHVLDVMHAFEDASREDRHVYPETRVSQPEPLPLNLPQGTLDAKWVGV
ncbi:MAG: Gfo/Idh/MocA family oxidoreductase [Chloroflexota bacterium]